MSLDGLRAWIGVVERKLTMRTRVFLVLVAIAIGGAGAGIVLAIDAQDNSVTKGDLQAVRDELAGTSAPAEGPDTAALEAEIETLKSEVAALRDEGKSGSTENPSSGDKTGGGGGGGGGAPSNSGQLKEAGEEAIEEAEGKESK